MARTGTVDLEVAYSALGVDGGEREVACAGIISASRLLLFAARIWRSISQVGLD